MAVTAKFYGPFFQSVFNKEVDADTDQFKLMLCTSAYVPNQDTHRYKSSVTSEVANGNGYATGGIVVSPMTVAYDSASNTLSIDGLDASWPSSTYTARYAVLYDNTPATDATRPLVGYVDFGQDMSPVNGTLAVVWDPAGVASVTVS